MPAGRLTKAMGRVVGIAGIQCGNPGDAGCCCNEPCICPVATLASSYTFTFGAGSVTPPVGLGTGTAAWNAQVIVVPGDCVYDARLFALATNTYNANECGGPTSTISNPAVVSLTSTDATIDPVNCSAVPNTCRWQVTMGDIPAAQWTKPLDGWDPRGTYTPIGSTTGTLVVS